MKRTAICLGAMATAVLFEPTASEAQGLPPAISAAGSPSATAMAVQGAANGIPVQSSDASNLPFSDWMPYSVGITHDASAVTGARSIEMSLTSPGTVTFTSFAGNTMTLPYAVTGLYQLPLVPARLDLGGGAAATVWMLR